MTTDTTECGLEQRICALLTHRADAPDTAEVRERPANYEVGWINGHSDDYDRTHGIDLAQLTAFLKTTQPHLVAALSLDADSPVRRKFLARLKNEVGKRGIVEVLRNGVKHGPHAIALLYGHPLAGQPAGRSPLRAEPLFGHAQIVVQQRQQAADPRPRAVHQRPAGGDL